MIAIENFMNIFLNVLNDTFRERVCVCRTQNDVVLTLPKANISGECDRVYRR